MLHAIETIYKGYRFRSRLEARWAVFFDTLSIAWEYEKEGYALGDLWYLPDFWLPELECWVEVKAEPPKGHQSILLDGKPLPGVEAAKARRLAHRSGNPVYVMYGPIEATRMHEIVGFIPTREGDVDEARPFDFAKCPLCGRLEIVWGGWLNNLSCGCFAKYTPDLLTLLHDHENPDSVFWWARLLTALRSYESPTIHTAYLAAQQARFEHGESGAPR